MTTSSNATIGNDANAGFSRALRIKTHCRFIAPADPGASRFGGATYAVQHDVIDAQPEQVICYYGNTAIGYTQGRRFVGGGVANGVYPLDSTAFMPETQNGGWKLFDQRP